MGFHFAGFALTPSAYPQNWDWYHNTFLGRASNVSNTWRPTSAILRVEDRKHPATKNLPQTFTSSPSEWYRWSNDLRTNPDIKILLSIDSCVLLLAGKRIITTVPYFVQFGPGPKRKLLESMDNIFNIRIGAQIIRPAVPFTG